MSTNDRLGSGSAWRLAIILPFVLSLLVPVSVSAGGIYIYKDQVYLDGQLGKTLFQPNMPVQMDFRYDSFAYAGKPNVYAIFEIYQLLPGGEEEFVGFVPAALTKGGHRATARFDLPHGDSDFQIRYHVVPYFGNEKLNSAPFGGYLDANDSDLVKAFYQSGNAPYVDELVTLSTSDFEESYIPKDDISIFFVNPTRVKSDLDAGQPITFQWRRGSESSARAKGIRYSYRMDPIEDWSIFSTTQNVTYNFLRPGNYTFQVRAEFYVDGERNLSSVATWDFSVDKQIFGLSKREILSLEPTALPENFFKEKHYGKSRAMLVGVETYQDSNSFLNLPYIAKDLERIAVVLKERGFSVSSLEEPATRSNIKKAFQNLYDQAGENDRVIVYLSGHGTSVGDNPYFVSQDCMSSDKKNTCLGFDYLKDWIDRMMSEKKIKHLLVVVDACQSGLGVLSKSERLPAIVELANYPSSHMLTAGLADQDAYIDHKTGMSVFTRYLAEGLEGAADITGDDVISLTELLIFVQNNVASYVSNEYQEKQTPVMGKINGAGEMIFLLK